MAPADTVPREAMVHPAEPGYGSSGSYGGYGSSGGYGSYGGGYGSSGGGGQGGFDFGGFGFDFEDLFGGGQRRNYQSTAYTENDPELRPAAQAVLAGRYSEALGLLRGATNRKAAWYYWSARANMGLGNRIAALNDARTAVNMAPDEPAFRELLAQLNAGSRRLRATRDTGGLWLLSLRQSLPDAVSGQHAVQLLLSGRAWRLLLLLN